MKRLSIRDLRSILPRLSELVEEEGELVITRRGTPIARILPMRSRGGMPSHAELRLRTQKLSSSAPLLREDRDAGG